MHTVIIIICIVSEKIIKEEGIREKKWNEKKRKEKKKKERKDNEWLFLSFVKKMKLSDLFC